MERPHFDPVLERAPHAGHEPVDEDRRQDVAVRPDHELAVRRRHHPGAVRVCQQRAVPHRHEPWRGGRVLVRERAAREVVQDRAGGSLVPLQLVAELGDRLLDRRPDDRRELRDVRHRRGTEALEIAADEVLDGRCRIAGSLLIDSRRRTPAAARTPTARRRSRARSARTGAGPTRPAASGRRTGPRSRPPCPCSRAARSRRRGDPARAPRPPRSRRSRTGSAGRSAVPHAASPASPRGWPGNRPRRRRGA